MSTPPLYSRPPFHLGLFLTSLAADQVSKVLALGQLGDRNVGGFLHSDHPRQILGDWIWFFVAYNPGSAFSLTPAKLIPFLSPTLFYSLLSLVAGFFLVRFYLRHPWPQWGPRLGATLILSGALGNLLDRFRMDHVVDFISVGIPGIVWRWPTFNVADSAICIGVSVLLVAEWQTSKSKKIPVSESTAS